MQRVMRLFTIQHSDCFGFFRTWTIGWTDCLLWIFQYSIVQFMQQKINVDGLWRVLRVACCVLTVNGERLLMLRIPRIASRREFINSRLVVDEFSALMSDLRFAIRYSPFTIRHSLFTICYLLFEHARPARLSRNGENVGRWEVNMEVNITFLNRNRVRVMELEIISGRSTTHRLI